MARTPTLFKGKVSDETADRRFRALERYVEDLERRLRKAEKTKHLPRTAEISLSSDQTSISVGTTVAFDSIAGVLYDEGLVKLATDGTVTLAPSHKYRVDFWQEAGLNAAAGVLVSEFRIGGAAFTSDSGVEPRRLVTLGNTVSSSSGECPSSSFEYTPKSAVDLTVEATTASSVTRYDAGTRIIITEVAQ